MYRIICLYRALLLSACGSDKEPLFRPTIWRRLPRPQPTKMQIPGHLASLAAGGTALAWTAGSVSVR